MLALDRHGMESSTISAFEKLLIGAKVLKFVRLGRGRIARTRLLDRLAKAKSGEFAALILRAFRRIFAPPMIRTFDPVQSDFALSRGIGKLGVSHRPLVREVAFAVAVKLMVILAAAFFVFGPGQRPRIDAASVQERLIGSSTASPQSRSVLP